MEVRGRKAVSGLRRAENGGMTTKSMKMAQNRVRSAHLREFAFICGPFGAFGGLRRAGKPVFYRKWTRMDANGDRKPNPCPSVFIRGWIGGARARKEAKRPPKWPLGAKNGPKMAKMVQKCPKRPFWAMSRNGARICERWRRLRLLR